jgi:hypothetical protein
MTTTSSITFSSSSGLLRYNLFDAALVEQQDSRDHILGHTFSGGPAHFFWIKIETETVGPVLRAQTDQAPAAELGTPKKKTKAKTTTKTKTKKTTPGDTTAPEANPPATPKQQ